MRLPATHSRGVNGPVPAVLSPSRCTMAFLGNASLAGSSGSGDGSSIITVSPTATTFHAGLLLRSEATTEAASSGKPSVKETPSRRKMRHRWFPGSACQELARSGCGRPFVSKRTKFSKINREMFAAPGPLNDPGSMACGASRIAIRNLPP